MRVRAYLTNSFMERVKPYDPQTDHSFRVLANLFDTDPRVLFDFSRGRWALEASVLDEADDADRLGEATDYLLKQINGIAALLTSRRGYHSIDSTVEFRGRRSGTRIRIYSVELYSPTLDGLSATTAQAILSAAADHPALAHMIGLLSRENEEFLWYDLWGVRDLLVTQIGSVREFHRWANEVASDQIYNFERSANDPSISGPTARHSVFQSRQPYKPVRAMSPSAARELMKSLVAEWARAFLGLSIRRQTAET